MCGNDWWSIIGLLHNIDFKKEIYFIQYLKLNVAFSLTLWHHKVPPEAFLNTLGARETHWSNMDISQPSLGGGLLAQCPSQLPGLPAPLQRPCVPAALGSFTHTTTPSLW